MQWDVAWREGWGGGGGEGGGGGGGAGEEGAGGRGHGYHVVQAGAADTPPPLRF
jgi:hypothetical protein